MLDLFRMAQPDSDPFYEALSAVLRKRRQDVGISQEELAHRAGRSLRYVSLLENCKHQPSLRTLRQLCEALDISLSELIIQAEQEAKK